VADVVDDSGAPVRTGSAEGGRQLHLLGAFFEPGQRVSMGGALLLGIAFLAPVAALQWRRAWPSATGLAALAGLGVFCTAAAFVCWGALIAAIGAGRALVVTYVNPVVAVVLGMALLGERPGLGAFAGLLLILAGSWLAADA
jgi:drug/metabolite transporter (DMT)-like permease